MVRKDRDNQRKRAWELLSDLLKKETPHLNGVLLDEADFISLFIKVRDDGTCLAVLKKYGEDGTPLVCFGSGYGVSGSLVAVDATVNGGKWKVDKPWSPKGA